MNSANKAICYMEVINMHSLCELFSSIPAHNTQTPQWYIQCTLLLVHKMHNKYKKYFTIHYTNTVAYTTHSSSYSIECKKEVYYTLVHTTHAVVHNNYSGAKRCTKFIAVHNTYMTQNHLGYLKVKLFQL